MACAHAELAKRLAIAPAKRLAGAIVFLWRPLNYTLPGDCVVIRWVLITAL